MAAESFDGSFYSRSVSLDLNLDVFWTIDNELETVRVAVHSKTSSGWAGIGVSEMGGMEGADIVYYEAAVRNAYINRTHVPLSLRTSAEDESCGTAFVVVFRIAHCFRGRVL